MPEKWAVYRTKNSSKKWIYGVRQVRRGIPADKAQRVTVGSPDRRQQQRYAQKLNR